jgi:hypothetical protein
VIAYRYRVRIGSPESGANPPVPTRPNPTDIANLSFIPNHSARVRMNEPLTRSMVEGWQPCP